MKPSRVSFDERHPMALRARAGAKTAEAPTDPLGASAVPALARAVELGDVWWKTSCHTGPSGLPSPCWRPDGLFPDEADCCSFYSCASCRAYRVRCALGTVFDRRLGLCNHPHAAPTCLAPNPGCYLHY
ncbi:hypothetical protein ISCGN_013365 [Ixodes scapularis]